jgi:hypothetical protein
MDTFAAILVGIIFTFYAALVFTVLTLILDKLGVADFQIWGSGTGQAGWFWEFYKRYLIIAAVYTVCLPFGGLIGIPAMALAYKYVFSSGWGTAAWMGTIGGVIALVSFIVLIPILFIIVLIPLAMFG